MVDKGFSGAFLNCRVSKPNMSTFQFDLECYKELSFMWFYCHCMMQLSDACSSMPGDDKYQGGHRAHVQDDLSKLRNNLVFPFVLSCMWGLAGVKWIQFCRLIMSLHNLEQALSSLKYLKIDGDWEKLILVQESLKEECKSLQLQQESTNSHLEVINFFLLF